MWKIFLCLILLAASACATYKTDNRELSQSELLNFAKAKVEKISPNYTVGPDLKIVWGKETAETIEISIFQRPPAKVIKRDKGNGTFETVTEVQVGGGYELTLDKKTGEVIELLAGQ